MGNATYSFENHEGKDIIIRTFHGDISLDDIIKSFDYLLSEKMITESCVGIITDIKSCQLNIPISELSKLVRYMIRHKDFRNMKLALIADTPDKTVIPIIVAKRLPITKVKPFSGKEAAIAWLMK